MSARTSVCVGRGELMRTFCEKGESIFRDFVPTSFMDVGTTYLLIDFIIYLIFILIFNNVLFSTRGTVIYSIKVFYIGF